MWNKNHGKCPPAMCAFKTLPNLPGSPHRCSPAGSLDAKRAVSSVVKVTKPVEVHTNGSPADRVPPKCHVKTPRNWGWNRGFEAGDDRGWWWLIIPKNQAAYFFGQTWHCNGGVAPRFTFNNWRPWIRCEYIPKESRTILRYPEDGIGSRNTIVGKGLES